MLDLGKMKDRFAIVRLTPTQGADNEVRDQPKEVRKVWGHLKTLSGRQLQIAQAGTVTSTATHLITLRYCTDVRQTDTELWLRTAGGQVRRFVVNLADDVDNAHEELRVTVTEVTR